MSDSHIASGSLELGGAQLDLPIVEASEGASGADISKLLAKTGYVTFDPGFGNTASCSSAITYIDGDAGILRYRGYPIDQLAEKSSFVETSYLLIHGELPSAQQLSAFEGEIKRHTLLHEDLKQFFDGFPGTPTRCPCCPQRCRRCRPSIRTR